MRKLIMTLGITATLLLSNSHRAEAQEGGSAFGVGMETILNAALLDFGPAAAALHYEAPKFHVDGLLLFLDIEDASTTIGIGGRFWYALHKGQRSDFSVGGGLLLLNVDSEFADSETDLHLEGGVKLRAWITPNISVNAILGLSVLVADEGNDVFGVFGQLHNSFGVTYVFR